MAKSPAQRKVPRCTLCGHNATRQVADFPVCRQCHEGGQQFHAEKGHPDPAAGLAADVTRIAKMNGVVPLAERMYVGDSHTRKDGTQSRPIYNDRRG